MNYNTGNIIVPVGKLGIEITADNVTMDLSGYTVIGVPMHVARRATGSRGI